MTAIESTSPQLTSPHSPESTSPREVIRPEDVGRAPSAGEVSVDRWFRWATRILAGFSALLVVLVVLLVA